MTVNDPQIWTLIGVFAAIMLGGMTLMTTLIMRATTASVDGLRGELSARFDKVDLQFQHLDRDVAALTQKAWGEPDR
jgi:hypothetical protein